MPDRDVFDRNVSRGWKRAARLIIGHDGDPEALQSVIRALGKELRSDGCPGFDAIVRIVTEALHSTDQQLARRRANEQLERLCCKEASSVTEIAVAAAERLLARPPWCRDDALPLTVAIHILPELAEARMCPAPMIALLVEEGDISFQTLHSRLERAKLTLAATPEIHRLAAMLLADPSGASVKTPRMRRRRMSQADILVSALTD